MDWLLVVAGAILLYAAIAWYIHSRGLWPDHIAFYGPFLALKTDNVGFFDRVIPYSRFLRLYGTFGAVMVIIVSGMMSFLLLLGLHHNILQPPSPTGIYAPSNILAIPGINQFIPLSFAVIFAFFITLVVHEFGHAILCRVEGIRVKSTGILFAVIPIGAFVEPVEEDVEKTHGMPKIRMFGAGITNNMVVAACCFILLLVLMSTATPLPAPNVKGVYEGYPADNASLPFPSTITSVNGVSVETIADVSGVLNATRPGDVVTISAVHNTISGTYTLTLAEWPEEYGEIKSGFMGVSYYNPLAAKKVIDSVITGPLGPFFLLYVPINAIFEDDSLQLGILAFDMDHSASTWKVPFSGFWIVIQVLFWSFWFNFAVGTFNALPFVPLDGGYIMEEGVMRFCEKRGRPDIGKLIATGVSALMITVVIMIILVPYLFS